MIAYVALQGRKLRRLFSRSYWAIRLLRLSKSENTSTSSGLVLIQIDGLSTKQLERGIREGHLPFLKSLMSRQKYKQYVHFSGVPSTTPAIQGELFYGVKGCVPAFNFIDSEVGETFKMFEPKAASTIEARLAQKGTALLEGGSAYADIFTGGAAEPHFCAASIGWNGLFKILSPFTWFLIVVFHLDALVRILVLLVLEFILAFIESIHGSLGGERLTAELMFILARMLVCVLLREQIVIGAKIDIARGLPIIHLNFFGYDEQSHRRGPSSKFAHRALRGIDDAVSRIWNEAKCSDRRDYDIWIYSDHGQEDTLPYEVEHHRTIEQTIEHIFDRLELSQIKGRHRHRHSETCCGSRPFLSRFFPESPFKPAPAKHPKVTFTGMGPIGHIYPAQELDADERKRVIRELLQTAKVPLVLTVKGRDQVEAWTEEKMYTLPQDAAHILGDDHPFLKEAAEDLVRLCHHPSAGKIVIAGWIKEKAPRTYPLENGSHCSFGPEETRGFALLPVDAPVLTNGISYLRPTNIREAALRQLGKLPPLASEWKAVPGTKNIRVMTYNVHACVGMDGKLSTDRIARVIARHDIDVVALQELDVTRKRSGGINQVEAIAKKLNMSFHFHPSFVLGDEKYGNAILSRYPMKIVKVGALPRLKANRLFEPRGALWAELDLNGTKVNIVTSHLSLWPAERLLQAEALLGSDWIGSEACNGFVIFCGDLNAQPSSLVCQRMGCKLQDAQTILQFHVPSSTYFKTRLDHVFISPGIKAIKALVPRTDLDRLASDHLPLIVDLQVEAGK